MCLLVLVTLAFIAIPMFIVLALPVTCFFAYLFYVCDDYDDEKFYAWFCFIPAALFSLCCGCICNVIAIPIGLLLGPCFLTLYALFAIK